MRWASTYQSIVVPIPKPPKKAIIIMVMNQAIGKSPDHHPVKANGLIRSSSPSAASLSRIPVGPPAIWMPHTETIIMTRKAITPCWKSAITTPQYPAASTYMAHSREKTTSPIQVGHANRYSHTRPIAIPTQPSTNIFIKNCHPAIQPRSNSLPRPVKRTTFHSACV